MKKILLIFGFILFAIRPAYSSTIAEKFLQVASCTLPGTISQGTLTNNPPQLLVSWTTDAKATSYNVYYCDNATFDATTCNGSAYPGTPNATAGKYTGKTGTSFEINGPLTESTTYYTKVAGVNACGTGTLSSSQSAAATAALPSGAILTVALANSGSNYSLNDICTASGGTGGQVQVSSVISGCIAGGSTFTFYCENTTTCYEDISSCESDCGQGNCIAITSENCASYCSASWTTGIAAGITLYARGSGYSVSSGVSTSGGTGTGLTVNITSVAP